MYRGCGSVVVSFAEGPNLYAVRVPEPDSGEHIEALLESTEADATSGDVSYQVDRETFQAHKLILAVRSAVFKAEFDGTMPDRNSGKIHVKDMEAPVFKAMRYFMYRDAVPDRNR